MTRFKFPYGTPKVIEFSLEILDREQFFLHYNTYNSIAHCPSKSSKNFKKLSKNYVLLENPWTWKKCTNRRFTIMYHYNFFKYIIVKNYYYLKPKHKYYRKSKTKPRIKTVYYSLDKENYMKFTNSDYKTWKKFDFLTTNQFI